MSDIKMDKGKLDDQIVTIQDRIEDFNSYSKKIRDTFGDVMDLKAKGEYIDELQRFVENAEKYLDLCEEYYYTQIEVIRKVSELYESADVNSGAAIGGGGCSQC